jgi:quinol monooxygenase YgiN
MIVEYTRYKIDARRKERFLADYKLAGDSLKASKHCLSYELSQCSEDADQFVLRIEWDSEEGHLKGFRSSPEFGSFFSQVRAYVNDIKEMRHYKLTDVLGKGAAPSPMAAENLSRINTTAECHDSRVQDPFLFSCCA